MSADHAAEDSADAVIAWPRGQSSGAVVFSRRELYAILTAYGAGVNAGHWRDYAIDFLKDQAVFSIFRRTSEMPVYRVVKSPKLARRQGAFSVVSATGQILKRGHEIRNVLSVFNRKRLKVVK